MRAIAIIPAYNEEASILKTVCDVKEHAVGFDYIIINDCSKDNTLKICKENSLNVIDLPFNLGIGGVSSISPMQSIYYMIKVTLAILVEGIR